MRSNVSTELHLSNKNVDSLVRGLQRTKALGILPGRTVKECEIRLEELRSAFNVWTLEATLAREQTDRWRLSRLRAALDDARRRDPVQ